MRLSSGDPRCTLGQEGRFPHPEASAGAASIRRFLYDPKNAVSDRSLAYVEALLNGDSRADVARRKRISAPAVTQALQRLATRLAEALRSA